MEVTRAGRAHVGVAEHRRPERAEPEPPEDRRQRPQRAPVEVRHVVVRIVAAPVVRRGGPAVEPDGPAHGGDAVALPGGAHRDRTGAEERARLAVGARVGEREIGEPDVDREGGRGPVAERGGEAARDHRGRGAHAGPVRRIDAELEPAAPRVDRRHPVGAAVGRGREDVEGQHGGRALVAGLLDAAGAEPARVRHLVEGVDVARVRRAARVERFDDGLPHVRPGEREDGNRIPQVRERDGRVIGDLEDRGRAREPGRARGSAPREEQGEGERAGEGSLHVSTGGACRRTARARRT